MINKVSKVVVVDEDGDLIRIEVGDETVLVHVTENTVAEVNVLLCEHLLSLHQSPQSGNTPQT